MLPHSIRSTRRYEILSLKPRNTPSRTKGRRRHRRLGLYRARSASTLRSTGESFKRKEPARPAQRRAAIMCWRLTITVDFEISAPKAPASKRSNNPEAQAPPYHHTSLRRRSRFARNALSELFRNSSAAKRLSSGLSGMLHLHFREAISPKDFHGVQHDRRDLDLPFIHQSDFVGDQSDPFPDRSHRIAPRATPDNRKLLGRVDGGDVSGDPQVPPKAEGVVKPSSADGSPISVP